MALQTTEILLPFLLAGFPVRRGRERRVTRGARPASLEAGATKPGPASVLLEARRVVALALRGN
jgi:hypothetical protein